MTSNETIDCVLLSYSSKHYLLPTNAMMELVTMGSKEAQIEVDYETKNIILGKIYWRAFTLPLISPDLLERSDSIHPAKVAIVHALYSKQSSLVPFFGMLFEGTPRRIKLTPHQITWLDETQKQVQLLLDNSKLPAWIPNLNAVSQKIEQYFKID